MITRRFVKYLISVLFFVRRVPLCPFFLREVILLLVTVIDSIVNLYLRQSLL